MKMRRLESVNGMILFFFTVQSVTAEFFEADTEVVEFENKFYDNGVVNLCPFNCEDFCKEEQGVKIQCAHHVGESYQRCQCEKTIPIRRSTCLSDNSRCYKTNFVPKYRDKKCYCTCDNKHCDDFCKTTKQLGKCKPEYKQKLNESTCQCYCSEADCERKRGSFFLRASCNAQSKCVTTCNGTQEGLPSWCRLAADKCDCFCKDAHCQQYCKNEKNKPHGVCVYRGCACQVTPFQDNECTKYCYQRTGTKKSPRQLPSKTGYCECRYDNELQNCYSKCERSNTCSVNDPCFCKDDPRATNASTAYQTLCSGKLCWSERINKNKPQNASLQWVFASTRMESESDFKWVVCRSYLAWFGIARMKKLGASTPSDSDGCLLIEYSRGGTINFTSTNDYHGLMGQRCGFQNMKKGDKIPKEAFQIVGIESLFFGAHYFGRDKVNNIFGAIKRDGIMIGGNPDTGNWKTQKPVSPETFEILICT